MSVAAAVDHEAEASMDEDTVVSAPELEAIVMAAVAEAVGQEVVPQPVSGDATVAAIGRGFRTTVRRAVMLAIRALVQEQTLLSGPLAQAARALRQAQADTEDLWAAMESMETMVEAATGGKDWTDELRATTADESSAVVPPPPPAPVAAPVPAPVRVAAPAKVPGDVPAAIEMDGFRRVVFGPKTPPEFRTFLREYMTAVAAGPVKPVDVVAMAERNGYLKSSKGTITFQIEQYLGKVVRDKEGRWIGHRGAAT